MSAAVPASIDMMVVVMIAAMGTLFVFLPDLTRPSLYFAVTVDPEIRHTAEGRRARTLYRTVLAAGTGLSLALALIFRPSRHPAAGSVIPLLLVVLFLGGYLAARRLVLPHSQSPDPVREADVLPRSTSLPGGPLLQSLPFVVLTVVATVLALRWETIPARFPVHWSVDGTPDAWAVLSLWNVFEPVVTAVVICGLLLLVAWGVARRSRRLAVSGADAVREDRFRRLMLWVIWAAEAILAGISSCVALLPLIVPPSLPLLPLVIAGVTSVGVTVLVLYMVRFGQGGSRLPRPDSNGDAREGRLGDQSEDRLWKAGIFYFNPGDPTLFVEKRFGIGYTVNFGNPWALAVLALVLLVPVLLTWLRS